MQRKKPHVFAKYGFGENQEKPWKIGLFFFTILAKKGNFLRFFLIFSETILWTELRFFALHSVHHDASFELSKSTIRRFFRFCMTSGTSWKHAHKWFAKSGKINITLPDNYRGLNCTWPPQVSGSLGFTLRQLDDTVLKHTIKVQCSAAQCSAVQRSAAFD